jgi:hypothetical protein
MFYVIGHDESGKLISLTSRAFPTQEAAQEYADTCNQGWTPFVVQNCDALPKREACAEQRIAELEKNQQAIQALARRTLWIAFCWNDHNFGPAHLEARKEAERAGIDSFEAANRFIEAMPEIQQGDEPL